MKISYYNIVVSISFRDTSFLPYINSLNFKANPTASPRSCSGDDCKERPREILGFKQGLGLQLRKLGFRVQD